MMNRRSILATLILLLLGTLLVMIAVVPAAAETVPSTDPSSCASCHKAQTRSGATALHVKAGVTCLACHPADSLHKKSAADAQVGYSAEACAKCHTSEYQEWRLSAHNQPVPYTPDEIVPALITNCVKCHNAAGYLRVMSGSTPFESANGEIADASSPAVTCVTCHDPHAGETNLLRSGSLATTCEKCHADKWQNIVLNGTGGQRYPDSTYKPDSTHNLGDRCVTCHMAKTPGVLAGGHTLRMRDQSGAPNVAPCTTCHAGARDFDIDGKQGEIKGLLTSLEEILKERNLGELPGFQPGKCNQCHRGGTEPFKNDPQGQLEQAFQNYRLFLNDRSLGVHNYAYTSQMLRDSMKHVLEGYSGARTPVGPQGCCGHQG